MNKWVKRFFWGFIGSVVVLVMGYASIDLALSRHYYPDPPEAEYPAPGNTVEARRQDLDYFRHFLELDKSYTPESRARAAAILASLDDRLDTLSDAGFQLEVARAVAAADNGHTNIWIGRFSRAHGRLPLRFYWFEDGLYVVRAPTAYEDLLGAELVEIGGVPIQDAAERLRLFTGGTWEGFKAYRGPVFFELPAAHHAVGLTDSESASLMTFRIPDGSLTERRLESWALPEETPLYWPASYLFSALPEPEPESWLSLASRIEAMPLYLEQPESTFRMAPLVGDGLYVQFRANMGEGIESFVEQVRETAVAAAPAYLVIDQRFNGGGDYTLTESLMNDLPGLVADRGPVYVIVGGGTFSAGINSVAFAMAAGGDQVILVGGRPGDRERIYGETNNFELPNSGLGMTFNTGLHDVENGCPPFPQCYWRNYFSDVAVGRLDPDIPVATTHADYLAGRDPALERILVDRGLRDFAPEARGTEFIGPAQ